MNNPSLHTILILGSGFGGIRCALDLHDRLKNRDDIQIVLVDKRPYQVFNSSLYEVAAAKAPREAVCLPIRKAVHKRSIRFIQDIVEKIDPVGQSVTLHQYGELHYNYLVVALGAVPNDYGIPGLRDHAISFYSFDDALAVRRQVQHLMRTKGKVNLVIGGGGPTGTELAAAFRYYEHDFCSHKKHKDEHLSVTLVEAGSQLLNGLPTEMAIQTDKKLRQLGANLSYGNAIKKVTAKSITLADGSTLPYDVFVWSGGIKANAIIQEAGFALDSRGRLLVSKNLHAKGYTRVYGIGDITSFAIDSKHTLPQVAPHAIWQGEHVAKNIARQINKQHVQPYEPKNFPTLIPLGGNDGLLRWGPYIFGGRLTLWAKRLVEWDYFTGILPISTAWHVAIRGKHTRHTIGHDAHDPIHLLLGR